jgi:hypothetical protein
MAMSSPSSLPCSPSPLNESSVSIDNTNCSPSDAFPFNERVRSHIDSIKFEAKALFTFHPSEWMSAFRPNDKYPLFVVGDIDGFVALFMNNLATLLAVILGLKNVFKDELIYGRIVPGLSRQTRHRLGNARRLPSMF